MANATAPTLPAESASRTTRLFPLFLLFHPAVEHGLRARRLLRGEDGRTLLQRIYQQGARRFERAHLCRGQNPGRQRLGSDRLAPETGGGTVAIAPGIPVIEAFGLGLGQRQIRLGQKGVETLRRHPCVREREVPRTGRKQQQSGKHQCPPHAAHGALAAKRVPRTPTTPPGTWNSTLPGASLPISPLV